MAYKTTEVEKYNLAKSVWEWLKKDHQNDQYDDFEDFDEYIQDALTVEITGEHKSDEDDNSNEYVIVRIAGKEVFTAFNFLRSEISGETDRPILQPNSNESEEFDKESK